MKGSTVLVGVLSLSILLTMMVLVIATDTLDSVDDMVKAETTNLVSRRIDTAALTIHTIEKGSVELNLKEKYGFMEEDGDYYINYSVGGFALEVLNVDTKAKLNNPAGYELIDEGRAKKICLKKRSSSIDLQLEGCEP